MAQTLKNEEERQERVLLVGKLFQETGLSTRKLAAHITANFFSISNYTVSDYLKRYVKLKPEELDDLKNKIYSNAANSMNKAEVKKRVKDNAELFEQGYTIEEIAKATNTSFWTVYRDITSRLRALDSDRYEGSIKPRLSENSLDNIKKNK